MEGDMEQGVDCWVGGGGGIFKNRWYGMGLHWTPDCFTAQVDWCLHTAPATVTALLRWGDWPCSKKNRLLGTTTQRVTRELACGHPDVTIMDDWALKKSVIYLPIYWSLYTGEVWDYWRHGLHVKRRFDHRNPLVHKICEICLIAAWMKVKILLLKAKQTPADLETPDCWKYGGLQLCFISAVYLNSEAWTVCLLTMIVISQSQVALFFFRMTMLL